MEVDEIKEILMRSLPLQEAYVTGDGRHFYVTAIGELFANMSRIEQQRAVYALFTEALREDRLHALSIKTYTPAQWQQRNTKE